ncbi:hypothetical protein [Chromobacterium sp. Beijing]|uniref:hypothetical protein n=1 Tax=Chromobacterium sp. Beijing TaxID=2735795 RepID=UPI001F3EF7AD|nr:hypothetical protein [Chromobacterium sp. Beijing]UJB31362.1 hypothetical protein HQN78_10020 [Chromobacterium sp. Beijing]
MTFQTAAHKAAQANLAKFIEAARSAIPFGPIQWEAVCWEVPNKARASSGRKVERLWFNANFTKKTTLSNVLPFPEPFASFVKAFVCHRESRRENGLATLDHMVAIRALRYLFSVLQDRADTPIAFIHADFDNAINLCLRKEQHSSAYRIGCKLAEIAEVIDQQRLVPIRIEWQNSVPRNNDAGGTFHSRVGHAFTEHRMRKLPSDAVMQALAEIANRTDLEDHDLLRQRAIDLLVCGGFRINELLTLPHDCWRAEEQLSESGQPLLDRHGRPTTRFGIRYIPEKGGHTETQTKWLPTVMQDVAKRALNDIQSITQPFREIARFMADHPDRTLLPEPWHALPADALLNMEEIAIAVGLKNRVSAKTFARSSGLPFHKKPGKNRLIDALRKSDLESHLTSLSVLDNIFPQGQAHYRLHECLFVIGVNFIGAHRGTLNGTATLLTDGQISDYVIGRTMGYSIFARLNYTDEQGSP